MRTQAEERDHGCYCCFHYGYGHDTEECYDLKNHIEDLIRRDHLDQFVRKLCEPSLCPKSPVERQIDVIIGGPVTEETPSMVDPKITFESESEYPNHDDSLVIIACIANAYVKRIMIDTRSSTDILYLDAFQKLSMTNRDLIPMTLTLTGFTGDAITPVGIATLPMLLTMSQELRPSWFLSWWSSSP
ncbi:hypothetical protein GW17_00027146 [Ensete ventricosum]|nr:hypothetical protein GW17_00027146 [Ensete ventricosum]